MAAGELEVTCRRSQVSCKMAAGLPTFANFADARQFFKLTMSPKQPNRAPPVGRVLRILLGLLVIVYVTPIYLRLPLRVFVGSLVLMIGLILAYSAINLVVSRRVAAFGPYLAAVLVHALLVASYVAGFSRAPVVGGGKGQLAAVTFLGISLVIAGIRGLAGCELMAIPDLFVRKDAELACLIFSPLDKLERRLRNKGDL